MKPKLLKLTCQIVHLYSTLFRKFCKDQLNSLAKQLCSHTHSELPLFRQNGRHDVIIWPNFSKLKRAPLDLWETISAKFRQNRPSSFAKRLWTDRHTDRQTDRQTNTHTDTSRFSPRYDHNIFSQ